MAAHARPGFAPMRVRTVRADGDTRLEEPRSTRAATVAARRSWRVGLQGYQRLRGARRTVVLRDLDGARDSLRVRLRTGLEQLSEVGGRRRHDDLVLVGEQSFEKEAAQTLPGAESRRRVARSGDAASVLVRPSPNRAEKNDLRVPDSPLATDGESEREAGGAASRWQHLASPASPLAPSAPRRRRHRSRVSPGPPKPVVEKSDLRVPDFASRTDGHQ